MIDRGKRSKTLSEVKPIENISKNVQSFLEIIPMQKESFFHINCETMHMSTRIPSEYLSQRDFQNQLSHPGLSHTEQECEEILIQGKTHNQQYSNEGLEYS